jgi:hypothetical protein
VADTQPPVTTDPILTVAPNSGATPTLFRRQQTQNTQSQLIVTVTGLPSDRIVLLSDGVTLSRTADADGRATDWADVCRLPVFQGKA